MNGASDVRAFVRVRARVHGSFLASMCTVDLLLSAWEWCILCYRISRIPFPHLDLHRGDTM